VKVRPVIGRRVGVVIY